MTLEKLNREQEYLSHDFDDDDFAYCDKHATELVTIRSKDEDGEPITFSDWWTIVARDRARAIARVRGMKCAEIGEE